MELAPTAWGVISSGGMFFLGALLSLRISRLFGSSSRRSLALYLWHTFFCMAYLLFVINDGGDALMYYHTSLAGGFDFKFGTAAVQIITMFFSAALGLSLLGTALGFNLFGFIGLLAFDATLRSATVGKVRWVRQVATLMVLLPSVSFWSSGIGKDSLSFMAAGLALWAAQNTGRRAWLMALAIGLMLLVRPHISALMVMAVAASMVLERRLPLLQRVLFGALAVGLAASLIPIALKSSGLGEQSSLADVLDYVDSRQSYNLDGGGGIDIASMSLPVKLFTYLFRPLPFESHSVSSLAASFDNVVLLLLVFVGGWQMIKGRRGASGPNRAFCWIYSISAWLLLATTTANLGISMRQKWMFAPMLIFLFVSLIGRRGLQSPRRASRSAVQVIGGRSGSLGNPAATRED